MNKNHLLPALLFVLAACGGTASSSSAATSSASAPVDNSEYRLIGNQSDIGGWNLDNAPLLTRAAGTNSFSITRDLYQGAAWQIIIGKVYAGALNASNTSFSVVDKGVPWTKDTQGAFVVPANGNTGTVDDGHGKLNFSTLVHGSYTITFVSLPATARTLTITRNGNPIVPPPTTIDFYLVGNFTTPNWGDGFVPANKFTETSTAGTYEKTLDLLIGNQFKIVRMLGTAPTYLGVQNVDITLLPTGTPPPAATIGGSDNFTVSVHGSYKVTVVNGGAKPAVTFNRLGDPIVPPPAPEVDPANWFLVGSITDDGTPYSDWNPTDKEFAMIPVAGQTGVYEVTLALDPNDLFKVKTGDTWPPAPGSGRDLGFAAITSQPAGTFGNDNGNIKALASGTFRIVFTFAPSAGSIAIQSTGWIGYGYGISETSTQTTVNYVGSNPFYANSAQLNLLTPFNGTKQGVKFTFTGKANDTFMFKVEARGGINRESTDIVATGVEQTHIVSLATLSEAQRATLNLFIVFVKSPASTGTIVLKAWDYVDTVAPVAPQWVAVGGVNVTTSNGAMTMGYTTGPEEWWNTHAKIEMVGFDGTKTTVSVTFTGVQGHRYLFKFERPANRVDMEYEFIATGVEQTVTISLTVDRNNNPITEAFRNEIDLFVVFCKTTDVTGSVTVKPLVFSA